MALLQEDIADLAPLLPRGIDSGRVVGTCMEKHHGTRRKRFEGINEWFEREPDRLRIVVWIGKWLDADVAEDGKVIDYEMRSVQSDGT